MTLSGLETESADIFRLVTLFVVLAIIVGALGHLGRERKR